MRYLILIIAAVFCFTRFKNNKNLFRFTMIFYGGFLSLRFGQGLDYFSYRSAYELYQLDIASILQGQSTQAVNFDFGYNVLVGIFIQFGIPFEVFIAFLSITMVILLYRFVVRYSKNYMLSFLVIYASYGIVLIESALRQGIACILLITLAVPFLEDKKYVRAIAVMGVALTFHASSIVFSMVLLLYYIEPVYEFVVRNRLKIMILVAVPAILLLNVMGLQRLVDILPLPSFIESRLVPYISLTGYSVVALGYRLIMFTAVAFAIKLTATDSGSRKLLYILATGYLIYFMIAQVQILSRITMYFEVMEIVLIPAILGGKWRFKFMSSASKNRVLGIITAGYVAVVSVLFLSDLNFIWKTGAYKTSYVPYISLANKEDIEEFIDSDQKLYFRIYLDYVEQK